MTYGHNVPSCEPLTYNILHFRQLESWFLFKVWRFVLLYSELDIQSNTHFLTNVYVSLLSNWLLKNSSFTNFSLIFHSKNKHTKNKIKKIHTLHVHYAHAAANLNSGYSKYVKVARVHYFCTIALRTSRAVLTERERRVGLIYVSIGLIHFLKG